MAADWLHEQSKLAHAALSALPGPPSVWHSLVEAATLGDIDGAHLQRELEDFELPGSWRSLCVYRSESDTIVLSRLPTGVFLYTPHSAILGHSSQRTVTTYVADASARFSRDRIAIAPDGTMLEIGVLDPTFTTPLRLLAWYSAYGIDAATEASFSPDPTLGSGLVAHIDDPGAPGLVLAILDAVP